MSLDRALLEHVEASVREVAKIVANYRTELEAGGMSGPEAWALAQRLEERMLGPLFRDAETELRPAPWADIEALFLAVINLQLVMGQAPSAEDAVRYMVSAGVRIRPLSPDEVLCLELRAPIHGPEIARAFGLVHRTIDTPTGPRQVRDT